MDYKKYLDNIRFRFLKTEHKVPQKAYRVFSLLSKYGMNFEMANTLFPKDDQSGIKDFKTLCQIPKMSTLAIAAIIDKTVSMMPANGAFVNVGVWHGFTLLAGMMHNPDKICVGIDNFSEFGGPKKEFLERFEQYRSDRHHFYEKDYRDYFLNDHEGSIGFYIYDGEHSYQNQLEGLKIAEPFFKSGTIILVDDTNWDEPYQATQDFIAGSSHHYEVLFDQKTAVKTHPTYWNGIVIFRQV